MQTNTFIDSSILFADYSKLKFFNDFGYEIYTQTVYDLTWSITTKARHPFNISSLPVGYIISNVGHTEYEMFSGMVDTGDLTVKVATFPGSISISDVQKYIDASIDSSSSYDDLSDADRLAVREAYVTKYFNRAISKLEVSYIGEHSNASTYTFDIWPYVKGHLTLRMKEKSFNTESFENTSTYEVPDWQEYTFSHAECDSSFYSVINDILPAFLYGTDSSLLDSSYFSKSVAEQERVKSLWPYFSINGVFSQEKVSAGLVAANTIYALYDDYGSAPAWGKHEFVTPWTEDCCSLMLATTDDHELRYVSNAHDVDAVTWSDTYSIKLDERDWEADESEHKPVSFSIGVLSDEEGVYQNAILLYITDKSNSIYIIGSIVVNTEVVGEDERYRTLFTNFGVPDPVTYPFLFKEHDPDQESIDWELVNEKSKELFLSYDQIFPYAGTYKALMNAVSWLGYDDIYFKEWYKIIDPDKSSRVVLWQSVDLENKKIIESKLKRVNVSIDDFINYKKLNKLSMIYLINAESEGYDTQPTYQYDKCEYVGKGPTKVFDIPYTDPNYDYNSDALLAKLWSLKRWLEKHILGVSCHIVDVTGEGVYFYREKSVAYQTGDYLIDYSKAAPLTPYNARVSVSDNQMVESSALVRCSVHEFDCLKFSDYKENAISEFNDKIYDSSNAVTWTDPDLLASYDASTYAMSVLAEDGESYDFTKLDEAIDATVMISNPLAAPLLMQEMSYNLELDTSCGTLYEAASSEDQADANVILIKDNKITFYDNKRIESCINQKMLPIITLKKANIRKPYGDWTSNILFTVKPVLKSTGDTVYQLRAVDYGSMQTQYISTNEVIVLKPKYQLDSSMSLVPVSGLKYTGKTKYNVPLFIMNNYMIDYPVADEYKGLFDLSRDYVLEILDGELRFDNVAVLENAIDTSAAHDTNTYMSMEVDFSVEDAVAYNIENEVDYGADEQFIEPTYNFKTGRIPFYEWRIESSTWKQDIADAINKEKTKMRDSSFLYNEIAWVEDGKVTGSKVAKYWYKKLSENVKRYKLWQWRHWPSWLLDSSDGSTSVRDFMEDILGEDPSSYVISGEPLYERNDEIYNTIFEPVDGSLSNESYVQDEDLVKWVLYERIPADVSQWIEDMYNVYCSSLYAWTEEKLRDEIYSVNKYVDVKVNRLGDYSLNVIGYDHHNNLFFNSANASVNVWGVPPSVEIYTNSLYSNNSSEWYRWNCYGDLLGWVDASEGVMLDTSTIVSMAESEPAYPRRWRIYDLSIGGKNISYNSISYAIDSPKKYDTFNLENMTELCTDIVVDSSVIDSSNSILSSSTGTTIMLKMLDENEDSQELYYFGAKVKLYVYDEEKFKLYGSWGPYTVTDCSKAGELTDNNYYDDSWIKLSTAPNDDIVDSSVMLGIDSGQYKCFVSNVTEHDVVDATTDGSGNTTVMINVMNSSMPATMRYHVGDVIKAKYLQYDVDYPQYTVNTNLYVGETCYRIIDTSVVGDDISTLQKFTLDGSLSQSLIDNIHNNKCENGQEMYCKISYPQYEYVNYAVRVNGDADEESVTRLLTDADVSTKVDHLFASHVSIENFYNDCLENRTTFAYDTSKWFADSYLDNTYSGWNTDYDFRDLREDWIHASDWYGEDTETYQYEDFPVTLEIGKSALVSSYDTSSTFSSYRPEWKWQVEWADTETYEDNTDLKRMLGKPVLYRSMNNMLSVLTSVEGPNWITLEAIDPLGNRLFNTRSGIYVTSE